MHLERLLDFFCEPERESACGANDTCPHKLQSCWAQYHDLPDIDPEFVGGLATEAESTPT
jgi:hypothetical protein